MTTYKIYTHGCKVNQYDSSQLIKLLTRAGFKVVDAGADFAIINTCAVTKTAIQKCKSTINKAKRNNPNCKTVMLGCWPVGYRNEAKVMKADIVWGVGSFGQLIDKMKSIANKTNIENQPATAIKPGIGRSRYFIKIQDGCEQYCSYCIVPYTRGKLKSRSKGELIHEIEKAISSGYKEIVLSGVHLGLYGKERYKNYCLENLIEEIILLEGLGRIRLSSIEIGEVSDKIISIMKNSDKLCPHLHLPLQSGSNTILKAMNRPYTKAAFYRTIAKLRKNIPDIAITTDVIVGFPGESEKEFNETLDVVKSVGFSRMHVFPFSGHDKTPAFGLSGQIDRKEIKKRANKLRKLGEELQKKYVNSISKKVVSVVIKKEEKKIYTGKTEFYFDISFRDKDIVIIGKRPVKAKIGQIVAVKIP